MEDAARKEIFPSILAAPTTKTFLYVLGVFSLVVGFGAIWMNLLPISIYEARRILRNVVDFCRRWSYLGGREAHKEDTV